MHILGLMSGTSLDGLDLCLCHIDEQAEFKRILAFDTVALPADLKQRIAFQMDPATSNVQSICALNFDWARFAADSVQAFLKQHKAKADLLASHGQTLYHLPPTGTLQIGDGGVLAALTGITTVSQFRTADMALEGQGAPLVPFLDYHLFSSSEESRGLLNVGGMANITYLPQNPRSPEEVQAFDTGPGNVLIDVGARECLQAPFDKNGAMAQQGKIHKEILSEVLSHSFFAQKPPRSTGREVFGEAFALKLIERMQSLSSADILATLTAITAHSIAGAMKAHLPELPDAMYISGGGVHNQTLWHMLRQELPETRIASLTELGGDPDAKEALAFALLGYACLQGIPASLPSVTGAMHTTILGQIAPGNNWPQLLKFIKKEKTS